MKAAAQHILWELREYAAASIVGAAAEGVVGLALPPRIVPVERAPKVEADAELLATLGDLAGWAALCDLTRRDMHRKGRELRDDVHGFALDYLEGSRAGEAIHLKLCEAGADKNPRLRRAGRWAAEVAGESPVGAGEQGGLQAVCRRVRQVCGEASNPDVS